jgi:hypothetical protein
MARIVKRTPMEPTKFTIDGKRHEVPDQFSGIRSF